MLSAYGSILKGVWEHSLAWSDRHKFVGKGLEQPLRFLIDGLASSARLAFDAAFVRSRQVAVIRQARRRRWTSVIPVLRVAKSLQSHNARIP